MLPMRTTLTLEDAVAERIRQEAATGRRSFKQIINEALRKGLEIDPPTPRIPFRVEPHSSAFRSGIDPARLNQLVDELETNAFCQPKD